MMIQRSLEMELERDQTEKDVRKYKPRTVPGATVKEPSPSEPEPESPDAWEFIPETKVNESRA